MVAKKQKSFKVDFFVVTHNGETKNSLVKELLENVNSDFTEAHPLINDADEKYQIRSIDTFAKGKNFRGVFGRCRFGEKPVQGSEDGQEAEVDLKPGHGLVEKNYFLFFPDRNLIVYQRNSSGSHYSRLQRYLNLLIDDGRVALEPILTTDAYKRLIEGSEARVIDISFQQPRDASIYTDAFTSDAIKLVSKVGGQNARIRISVGRSNKRLFKQIKEAAITLAKGGLAKVARVKLEDESEPVDLIADRIVETITVDLQENGRPEPKDIYDALAAAESDRKDHLKTFFGK